MSQRKPKSAPHFKITGNREKYLSNNNPSDFYSKQEPISGLADKSIKPKPAFKATHFCPITSNKEYGFSWGPNPLEQFSTSSHR